jgi:hypothetical protein
VTKAGFSNKAQPADSTLLIMMVNCRHLPKNDFSHERIRHRAPF